MYQVIARRFRPQTFKELLGHEAVVQTLKNSLKNNRLAQAYLFSGPRGTGKTSTARVFAKAINCETRTPDFEPCNQCASCHDIKVGQSLDVIEIDGASNRGIDDVRKIIETVAIAASAGRHRIYIIDEVHMLTKEAFNALLKTLEEPPPKVLFLFATTEPHKVLPTIISRCQRFQLVRIPLATIVQKLKMIAVSLNLNVEEEALQLIAKQAEGGLRDAESLFDQIIGYEEGAITSEKAARILGLPSIDSLFQISRLILEGNYAETAKLAQSIYLSGRDLGYFLENLTDHFRSLLLVKLQAHEPLALTAPLLKRYNEEQPLFDTETLIAFIEHTLKVQSESRHEPLNALRLEALFYKLIRLQKTVPLGQLIERLEALEKGNPMPMGTKPVVAAPVAPPIRAPEPPKPAPPKVEPVSIPKPAAVIESLSVDPTPDEKDLKGMKPKKEVVVTTPSTPPSVVSSTPPPPSGEIPTAKLDTLLHFAAIELEGRITKK